MPLCIELSVGDHQLKAEGISSFVFQAASVPAAAAIAQDGLLPVGSNLEGGELRAKFKVGPLPFREQLPSISWAQIWPMQVLTVWG